MKKILLATLLAATGSANAHLMFPAQVNNGYELKFWADDHWEAPNANNVIGISGYTNNKEVKVGYDFGRSQIVTPQGVQPDVMTSEYDFGYYTFTQNAHYPKPRQEVSGAIYDTRHIYKLGKGIFKWNSAYSKPLGMKMEVTPLSNPLVKKAGDTLQVLVTLDGKPVSGVEFEDQRGDLDITTNKAGIANIKLREPEKGFYIIGATTKLPYQLADSQAKTLQLTGTLGFKNQKSTTLIDE